VQPRRVRHRRIRHAEEAPKVAMSPQPGSYPRRGLGGFPSVPSRRPRQGTRGGHDRHSVARRKS